MNDDEQISRRQVLAGLSAAATLSGLVSCSTAPAQEAKKVMKTAANSTAENRMPVAFLPHGGGPWPFVDLGFPKAELEGLASYLRSVSALPSVAPKALLVISAHWEEAVPTVTTSSKPPMLYDYYGFPPESYTVQWPAPGEPQLAARVQQLLSEAGFKTASDAKRGYDHGTFVPLMLTYPEADIPTVQLSLKAGLDPLEHLAMGRALAALRDEGVFILGSGMTFHNMGAMRNPGGAGPQAQAFDAWLQEAGTAEPEERTRKLVAWKEAPAARFAHPREEHLLPLMVVAGAAGEDRGRVPYEGTISGLAMSAYHFG